MAHTVPVSVTANALSRINLFKDISFQERADISRLCRGRHFSPHQQIVSQKDHSCDVYFIISGVIRVTYYSVTGKEISFRDMGEGEMFGELSAIDNQPRSAQIITVTDVTLISMSAADFRNVVRSNASIGYKVMEHLARLVRSLSERVVEFSALGVSSRIHAEVLRLSRQSAEPNKNFIISPVPTHVEIASRVSTHREAVTRELNLMEKSGIIERQPDIWIVRDYPRLKKMVCEVMGE